MSQFVDDLRSSKYLVYLVASLFGQRTLSNSLSVFYHLSNDKGFLICFHHKHQIDLADFALKKKIVQTVYEHFRLASLLKSLAIY